MSSPHFGEFRSIVIEHINYIDSTQPESYSTEWFLLKYLQRIVKSIESDAGPGKVESCVRGLVRFYIDNIGTKSELGERCRTIHTEYRRTLRQAQEQKT